MQFYLENKETKEIIELKDQLVFGRRSSCDVSFKDDLVSGFHCKFHIDSKGIFVEDLKASNPMQVNGIGIGKGLKRKLKHHDSITVGVTEFVFIDCDKKEDSSYKTMALEKVKIHETFDSDSNFKQNQKYWEDESKKKLVVEKLKVKIKISKESGQVIQSLKNECLELVNKKNEISKQLDKVSDYNLEELKQQINNCSNKIEDLLRKKDEMVKLYNAVITYKEADSQIRKLKNRIQELQDNYSEGELKELTKEYNSALIDLEKLKKKAS